MIFTFEDAINHALDYTGGNISQQVTRDVMRACEAAWKELVNAFNWSYLYKQGRYYTIGTFDSQTLSTAPSITYDHTGGTYERMATISGDTWPDWAGEGWLRVGLVDFRVDRRISATVITLDSMVCPPGDLPAGTQFTLYQDTYLLPTDFVAQDQAIYELNFGGMQFIHPKEWLFSTRYKFTQSQPWMFCITGDQKYPGRLVTRIAPVPYETRSIDFIYKHRPRPLTITSVSTGTASITNGTNVVTGVGTAFTSNMEGAVMRLSYNTTKPTSLIMGSNVSGFESIVDQVNSPTSLTLKDAPVEDFTGVAYVISDPVDIEQGTMLIAYLRCVEKHISISRILKDKPSASKQYDQALAEAKSADSRSFMGRRPSRMNGRYFRLRDHMIPGGNVPDGIYGN